MTWIDVDQAIKGAQAPISFCVSDWSLSLTDWFHEYARSLPWRELWKSHRCPYHIWVSEIMLQQTQIKTVVPCYLRFLQRFPDVEALASASEGDLRAAVAGLGYYRRFRLLHQGALWIVQRRQQFSGWLWPQSRVEWLEVPGVGPYTSAAIASITLSEHCGLVDGNVERVLSRIFDIRLPSNHPKLKKCFERLADRLISTSFPGSYNQSLMEVGQVFCTVRAPRCESCPVKTFCQAYQANVTHLCPQPKLKKAFEQIRVSVVIPQTLRGEVAVVERKKSFSPFLNETRGFLLVPFGEQHAVLSDPVCHGEVRHTITHHKLEIEVWSGCLRSSCILPDYPFSWLAREQVLSNLQTSFDRKVWKAYSEGLFASALSTGR
ncbi:MAG: hypothetical protein OXT67_14025 [Zetaproteobacteria bacterium]|nr:hypothetical protein [Zetaproteobacteria bacterium]